MKRNELFKILRGEMISNGMQLPDLAEFLGRSAPHVSRCMNNKADFTLSEQYKILHRFNRPASDLNILFPENGIGKAA